MQRSRTFNTVNNTVMGIIQQIFVLLMAFAYRTVFLMFLSKEYLGLNGLFTNVLSILSLADLGIGATIVYRLYKPIEENDVEKVSALMNFYKNAYRCIALVIMVIGLALLPAIKFLINKDTVIPSDINLQLIYVLFLFQTVSSYLFSYKQSYINANQELYKNQIFSVVSNLFVNLVRFLVLFLTKDYTWTLIVSIAATVLSNAVYFLYITVKYKQYMNLPTKLSKEERTQIYKDTFGGFCHQIARKVVSGTDNILITAFLIGGLAISGIYSNYSMIVLAVWGLFNAFVRALFSSVGNAYVTKTPDEMYVLFKKLQFINLWLNGFVTIGLFTLLNPFIKVWLGDSFLFNTEIVLIISLSSYVSLSTAMCEVMITACGLFMKDKLRALIEVLLNLGISIGLLQVIGVAGIFVGTIISGALTYFWRCPWLVYKNIFYKKQTGYYLTMFAAFAVTAAICAGLHFLFGIMPSNVGYLVLQFVIVIIVPNAVFLLLSYPTAEARFFREVVGKVFKRLQLKKKTVD